MAEGLNKFVQICKCWWGQGPADQSSAHQDLVAAVFVFQPQLHVAADGLHGLRAPVPWQGVGRAGDGHVSYLALHGLGC